MAHTSSVFDNNPGSNLPPLKLAPMLDNVWSLRPDIELTAFGKTHCLSVVRDLLILYTEGVIRPVFKAVDIPLDTNLLEFSLQAVTRTGYRSVKSITQLGIYSSCIMQKSGSLPTNARLFLTGVVSAACKTPPEFSAAIGSAFKHPLLPKVDDALNLGYTVLYSNMPVSQDARVAPERPCFWHTPTCTAFGPLDDGSAVAYAGGLIAIPLVLDTDCKLIIF